MAPVGVLADLALHPLDPLLLVFVRHAWRLVSFRVDEVVTLLKFALNYANTCINSKLLVELVGVLVVGALSVFDSVQFPHETVWSLFGRGYAFIPLLLPILGLVWLYRRRPTQATAAP